MYVIFDVYNVAVPQDHQMDVLVQSPLLSLAASLHLKLHRSCCRAA
jgi:hypothetical protein